MKRSLLILAALCCLMPVMAQKNNKTPIQQMKEAKQKVEQLNRMAATYTQKLDSVITAQELKTTLEFDQKYNCTKINEYYLDENGSWALDEITDYGYDEQNRIVSIVYSQVGYEEYSSKMTMEYDNDGRLSLQYMWSMSEDQWVAVHKIIYEYNAQGNVAKTEMYGIDDDLVTWFLMEREEYSYNADGQPTVCLTYIWNYFTGGVELDTKTEWTYNDQQQCIKIESFYISEESWIINMRTEYSYDNHGNLIQEIESGASDVDDAMVYSWKTEYQYDDHNNATEITNYNYDEAVPEWIFYEQSNITFDLSVAYNKVAGYNVALDGGEEYFKNKLLQISTIDLDDEETIINLYYSNATELNEVSEGSWVIWPNPTTEVLHLNGANPSQVNIFSLDGKLVMTLDNNAQTINVSHLANGSYLLKATMNDGTVTTQTFVKQ